MSILYAVAAVEAVLAVVGWFWKPRRRIVERRLSLAALLLALVGAATAQYTMASVIMMACTLVLLGAVFVIKSSLLAYIAFDKHVTQAYVLFDGCTKDEVSALARTLVPIGISPILTAQGLEDIARRGEDFRNAGAILEAVGKLSVALSTDFRMCIDLVITLKRFFDFDGAAEEVSDKVVVAAKNGTQPEELLKALRAFQKERPVADPLQLDEFMAAIVTLKRREQNVELSGESLAAVINELTSNPGVDNPGPHGPGVAEYARRMLPVIDRLSVANERLTTASTELGKKIARRGREGQRVFPPDDPVLGVLAQALRDFGRELSLVVQEAETCDPGPRLQSIHLALLESFRSQLEGAVKAEDGVRSCNFAEVGSGLELRDQGITAMQEQAVSLNRLISD